MGRAPDGMQVAIKVLHQHLGTSKRVRARFMREAKAVERIQHPNVVRFVETGEQAGVGQFIAMEFVDGKPLHDVLKDRKGQLFPLGEAMDLMLQTCRGMRAAHAAGVIHRDLKPENILLSNKKEMKVTDFSLARREQDSILLTRAGQVMGTPHFMSPEQAKGQAVDVRTDIYSLGAIMYVLLTSQFPFPNGTVAEVIAAHCEKPRPDPRAINPEVSEELARVCQRAMAIDRSERYATVEALIEELHRVLGVKEEQEQDLPEGALPPGARIDEFTVEAVLGAGGMGAVYRARNAAGEVVALKVLPPQPGRDPQERLKESRRFLNEAKLAKRVTSPHVYKVFKYGVDEGGQAFMAASLAEGTSLREHVSRNGPLKPEQVIKVARGICQALQAVHGAEVLHRDVTPANVMLPPGWETRKDAGVCIIDFGLAVPLYREKAGGGAAEPTALFKHRVQKKDDDIDEEALYLDDLPGGTPAYMAPEVLEDPADVDERADLYGLGSTMYYAATGHPPYSGDGIEAVLYQQKSQPPAPITQFNADFPEELSELIIQLLAHEPHTRPRSAKLCLSKLQRLEDPRAAAMAWRPDQQPMVAAVEAPPPPAGFQWVTFALGFVTGAVVMAGGAFAMQLFK
ncbi:MAG: serine/threonine protein kinase [Planctomycetes bacterium]|nr:serine/threonine protein kinase [Planctomycetota bacterium]